MKNKLLRSFIPLVIFFLLFTFPVFSYSQSFVTIKGKAYDKDDRSLLLLNPMIINKRSNQGFFADIEGNFSMNILPTDSLIFSAIGYKIKTLCFKDSIAKNQFYFEVALQKMQITLKTVSVFADRGFNEIQEDIDRLGIKKTYSTIGADAFQSPITALYERFSQIEKSKRQVAEWENEDLKRDILKDLFRLYIKYDIIKLSDEEFDDFIKYLNLSDDFIKNATQFELVMAIKGKYESFQYRWK